MPLFLVDLGTVVTRVILVRFEKLVAVSARRRLLMKNVIFANWYNLHLMFLPFSISCFILIFILNQQGEQLQKLKHHLDEEITFHQQQIKQLKDSVAVHENRIAELEKKKSA
jgi:cell division protein FtsB